MNPNNRPISAAMPWPLPWYWTGIAQAQLSSSTIKGQVTGATVQANLSVVAVNLANGANYRTTTQANGSYVITGLAPGSYEIRVGGQKSEVITVQIGETASVDRCWRRTDGHHRRLAGAQGRAQFRSGPR